MLETVHCESGHLCTTPVRQSSEGGQWKKQARGGWAEAGLSVMRAGWGGGVPTTTGGAKGIGRAGLQGRSTQRSWGTERAPTTGNSPARSTASNDGPRRQPAPAQSQVKYRRMPRGAGTRFEAPSVEAPSTRGTRRHWRYADRGKASDSLHAGAFCVRRTFTRASSRQISW